MACPCAPCTSPENKIGPILKGHFALWKELCFIGIPPCVPPELGNMRFWDALNGRAWLNNATKFGHGDLLCDLCDSAVEVNQN